MSPTKVLDRGSALQRVRGVIERLVRDGTAVARSDDTLHSLFPVAVSAAEGEALREWILREGATQTIEIGLGYGISALYVCEGLLANADPAAHHVAIDPYQSTRFSNCSLQFLEEAGVAGLVEHHAGESLIALARFLGEARRFDLAFVDDYQLPAVARAASFFLKNLGWMFEEVSAADDFHQWAVLRTSSVQDTRPFDYYVDF